jgi:hypothetical protein
MIIALAVFILAGCMLIENQDAAPVRSDTFEFQGTVLKNDLEGGFFAIEGDDGKTYEPINLPEAFKQDGMRVKATVLIRKDFGSIHMVGDIVEIIDIVEQ